MFSFHHIAQLYVILLYKNIVVVAPLCVDTTAHLFKGTAVMTKIMNCNVLLRCQWLFGVKRNKTKGNDFGEGVVLI